MTSLAPTSGPTSGGSTVVLTGTDFTGATAVKFGATNATSFTVNSATQITATAPAGAAGSVNVTVTTAGGTSATGAGNAYAYVAAPTVTAASPASGPAAGGTSVVLTGTNLTGATAVKFGATNATGFTVNSATQITATAPAGSGSVNITVTTPGGTSATGAGNAYSYTAAPTVTAASPSSGPTSGGTSVVLTGTNLTGATAVKFGGVDATGFTVNSATQITATAPAGAAGAVAIDVTTGGGSGSLAGGYTYVAAPSISNASPSSGPTGGGTSVVITGTNFTGVSSVKFGGVDAAGFTVNSATQITATTPAGAAGAVAVAVVAAGGTATQAAGFTYIAAPTVTSLAPTSGPAAGGTSVVLTGTNLTGATAVKFGAANATGFVVDSATQITATSPAGSGAINVTVTTVGGTSATGAGNAFSYISAPTLSAANPNLGPTSGGTSVVLTGTNLTGATAVTFGGVNASGFTVNSATQITATTPAGAAGAVDIVATTPGGAGTLSNGFTYVAAPTFTSASPTSGPDAGGTTVVITGSNFTGVSSVKFGGVNAASFTVDSATQITATTPSGSGAVAIALTAAGGTVSQPGAFTYIAGPSVSGLAPSSGPTTGGTSVTLTGANLAGATAVKFGATNATSFTVDSATQITATAPAGAAGSVNVTVTTAGGTSATGAGNAFTYISAPTLSAANPNLGPTSGGTSVVLTGTNLTGATAVTFGGVNASGFTVNSATQITATAPAGAAGLVDIVVTTPGGAGTLSNGFTYVAAPTYTSASPTSGPDAGGTTVVITGSNFTGVSSVKFGGVNATGFTVDSATQITATTPAGAAGAVAIAVTAAGGTVSQPAAFTYIAGPSVSGLAPSSGPTSGGTSVVLTGTSLTGATAVKFGGVDATGFTVNSATQITATAPAGAAGSVNVTVTTPGGTSVTGAGNAFTYISAPTLSASSPSSGPTAGGTSVTLTGTHLTGVTSVKFGATDATSFTVDSATQITATTPAGAAGSVDIVVASVGGSATRSSAFTYVAAPIVSALAPSSGPDAGGTSVVLTGTNLTGATAVKFGATNATSFTVDSGTQITATAPVGSGSVNVTVTTAGGTSATGAGNAYTYIGAPTVTAAAPSVGPTAGGTTVVVTGTNLTGATAVKFGGVDATGFTVNSATQITATAPAGAAGSVNVTVTTPGGTGTLASGYAYVAAPTLASVSPASGPDAGGASVVITGTDFTGVSAVKFGGVDATGFTVNSATQITATTPAGLAGAVAVAVTAAGGTVSQAGAYSYVVGPAVTSLAPTSGPLAGGTSVVLTGANLTGATAVKFGATNATSFTVNSATQITATAPAGAAGSVNVTVTTAGGTSPTGAGNAFTYVAAPTVAGATPSSGSTLGGTSTVLAGTNFIGVTSVKFGGVDATGFTVNSATQITATTPAGSAGAVDVSVTAVGGTATAVSGFTYVAPPSVSSVAATSGPDAGGASVVLTGTNFVGVTAVKFGSVNATSFTVDSPTQITAVSPAGAAGVVSVSVTATGGIGSLANAYTYIVSPAVTGLSPSSGPLAGGTSVVLTGANLTGATAVKFGATNATSFTVDSATQITATAPAGAAGSVNVTVTTPGGTSVSGPGNAYAYVAAPTVTAAAPTAGPTAGGTSVVLTGTNLTGATVVKFGATNATSFTVNSATQITATAPAGAAGSVNVTVTTPGGVTTAGAGSAYLYVAAPSVTTLAPTFGPAAGGTTVVLTGANLSGATSVKFGATNATSFTVDSATQITAVSPVGANGVVNVTVTTAGGTSATGGGNAFTYGDGPSVTALSQSNGVLAGGGAVVLTGANFTGATSVKFGATNATSFSVDSATQITATAPAGAAGAVNVTVTTPVGTSASGAGNLYTYVAAPVLSGLTPNTGYTTGGTSVVISGTNLTGATGVTFGALAATSFTVNSATQITAVSPAAAVGPVNVTVTTPGGTSGAQVFTYATPPPPAPTLTINATAPDGTVGLAYAGSFTAANGQAPYSFSLTAGPLPAGLGLTSAGALTGTPTAEGQFPITVTATDASQAAVSVSVTLTIKKAQLTLPEVQLNLTTGLDVSLSFAPAGGVAPYRYSLSGDLPPGLSFNSATGLLSGAPTAAGTYAFSVTATDSSSGTPLTVTRNYTSSVAAATPPVADPVSLALTPSAPTLTIDLEDKVHGDYTQIIIVRQPQFGTATVRVTGSSSAPSSSADAGRAAGLVALKGASLIYTRNPGYTGPDAFLYAAIGPGGQSPSARVIIGALPAPTANPDTALVGSGKSKAIAVTANDAGEFDSVTLAQAPAHGTASVSGLVVTYSGQAGYSGTDTFTYTLSGPGGVSAPATVTVTVDPPAVAGPATTVTVLAGQPVTVDLTIGATGGPFTAASVVSISPASSGVAVVKSPTAGRYTLTYTSNPSFSGTAVVQYTLANATSVSAPSTVTVIVNPRPDPTLDAQVRGLVAAQDAAARRFANTQVLNYGRRLEQLHRGGGSGADSMLSLQGGVSGEDRFEARERMRRVGPFNIAYAGDELGLARRVGLLGSDVGLQGVSDRGEEGMPLERPEPTRWGVWAAGSADLGMREAFTGQRGFRFTTDGLTVGADYRLNPRLAIGAGLGYGRDSTRVGKEGTKSRAEAFSGAVYGSFQVSENGFIDGVLGYGALSFDSRRFVTANGSMVTANRDGDQLFASVTGGGEYQNGRLMLSPYGRVAMTRSTLGAGTEVGDSLWALTYQSQEVSSLTASLGLRANYSRKVTVGELSPRVRLEYSHDFEGAADAGVSYADWQGGPVYRMVVDGLDRDLARIELGVDLRLESGLRFGLDLDNLLGANSQSHGVRLSIQTPLH